MHTQERNWFSFHFPDFFGAGLIAPWADSAFAGLKKLICKLKLQKQRFRASHKLEEVESKNKNVYLNESDLN
jgi:hypothetical protein